MPLLSALAMLAAVQGGHTYVDPNHLARPGKPNYLKVPTIVSRPLGRPLKAPPGFHINLFAAGLHSPRWFLVASNGDVFCTECYQGKIILLRDTNGTGAADSQTVFAQGLDLPFGMAIHRGYFYVANTTSVVRFAYEVGQARVSGGETIIRGIPSRGYRQHWTRNILFDGNKMYLTIGSETNKGPDPLPRAAIWRYNDDGTGKELIAAGIRNPVGLALQPETHQLWATCVERDYMGDDLVPDFLTRIKPGQNYGWPYTYIGNHRDPQYPSRRSAPHPVPDLLFTAHSTPLGLLFYTGNMFPADYRGDAFVAMRGSTNRHSKSGYKIVRVRFSNGKLTPGYDDFITGWVPAPTKPQVYGRPVGLAQLPDGSMLIADEGAHCIWRVSYAPKPRIARASLTRRVRPNRSQMRAASPSYRAHLRSR